MQFNHSMMKSELGVMIFFAITTWVYDFAETIFVVLDTLICVIFIVFVLGMRRSVNLFII
jgi:hypothetical protein